MTDHKNLPDIDTGDDNIDMAQQEKAAQLAQIKVQADLLGVPYAANIGLETLSERVRAHKASTASTTGEAPEAVAHTEALTATDKEGHTIPVPADILAQYAIFRAKQLVRISIQCVNPAKSDLQSDLYTVFSSSIGRISQVIPYQAPLGHHVPRALAEFLRDKTYVGFRPTDRKKGENGVDREHYEIPEFLIHDMPPLTAEEANRIVQRQDRVAAVNLEEEY